MSHEMNTQELKNLCITVVSGCKAAMILDGHIAGMGSDAPELNLTACQLEYRIRAVFDHLIEQEQSSGLSRGIG